MCQVLFTDPHQNLFEFFLSNIFQWVLISKNLFFVENVSFLCETIVINVAMWQFNDFLSVSFFVLAKNQMKIDPLSQDLYIFKK